MNGLPLGLETHEYWIIVVIACALCAGAFFWGIRSWQRVRIIEDAPTAKIRSAHQGYIELEGHGVPMPGDPIIAPLTNQNCIWYRYIIERKETQHTSQGTRTSWKVVRTEESDHLFHLIDDTGTCVVDPDHAEVVCDDKVTWYGDTSWPQSAPLSGKADRSPLSKTPFRGKGLLGLNNADYRYTEWIILTTQPLYVIGLFQSMSPAAHYSVTDITRDLIRTWKTDPQKIAHFDKDGNGSLDQEEFDAMRKVAQTEAQMEYRERAQQPDIHIIGATEDKRPFIISVYPEHQLTKRFRIQAYASLAVFFICGSAAAWLLQAAP